MSIQANMNQMLSIAGVMAKMNPTLADKAEKNAQLRDLKNREKILQQQYDVVSGKTEAKTDANASNAPADEFGSTVFTDVPDVERADKIEADLGDIAQKRFDLDPTRETYEQVLASEFWQGGNVPTEAFGRVQAWKNHVKAEQSAQEALKMEQTRTRNTRRRFLDYIKDEPTSLGTKFGELDPGLQKKLAAAGYSKAERKKIMDRKDAEKNG